MEMITNEIFRAIGYLFIAGVALFAYALARSSTKEGNPKQTLWKGFLWCLGLAFLSSVLLGNPSCEYGSDPVYGGCEQYADDGYEPTTQQRVANFAYFMTLLYIPVVFGAFKGKDE